MWSLSVIYVFRMLGLFIILPVFSLFGDDYAGSTPFLVGLAIGIYGLLQALLQVPFGMLSDRIGRKPVISLGLLLLAIGSVVAATSDHIVGVIIGRALQGAGALAAALMALAADLTRESQRTRIMAVLGMSIGLSFVLALVLGPLLIGWFSIDILFWLTAACALIGLVLLHTTVPTPVDSGFRQETGARFDTMRALLRDRQLLRLDASVFLLHLLITATFFAVPLLLVDSGLPEARQWLVYLVAMVLSLIAMVPLLIVAERYAMRGVLMLSVTGMLAAQWIFGFADARLGWVVAALIVLFAFLNTLEALLPSLVSRLAPGEAKGSAMGIYSSSQFLGAFVGGGGAGWLYGAYGEAGLFAALAILCGGWFCLLIGFRAPTRRGASDGAAHRMASSAS